MLTSIASQAPSEIQEIYLAVIGAKGVGKSTFIQHALDLRKPTNGPVSSSKVALSGVTYRFQLLELDLDDIDYSARQIKWPKYINSQLVPAIDGVLCLYDITDQETIAEIPEVLRKSPFHILALYRE
jgi:GTPase SAR1 family protein